MHRKLMILPNYESLHRARFSFEPKPIEAVYHVLKKMNANDTAGIFQTVAEKKRIVFCVGIEFFTYISVGCQRHSNVICCSVPCTSVFVCVAVYCLHDKGPKILTFIGRTFPKGTKPSLLSLEII